MISCGDANKHGEESVLIFSMCYLVDGSQEESIFK